MNQKERLADLVKTMACQQKQEQTFMVESVNRLRKDQKIPLWWNAQQVGRITTQLSNMGWRTPHFEYFTQKGEPLKRLTKEPYLIEFVFLGELDY